MLLRLYHVVEVMQEIPDRIDIRLKQVDDVPIITKIILTMMTFSIYFSQILMKVGA